MTTRPRTRRGFFGLAAAAAAGVGLLGHAFGLLRALVPNVRYEPPARRRLGTPEQFPDGATYLAELKLFVIRRGSAFRALSAVCPHLGCTVAPKTDGYHCPCHGSRFDSAGVNTDGPAPRPLSWRPLSLAANGSLIVDTESAASPETVLEWIGDRS